MVGRWAVSYTHLDVYKRQVRQGASLAMLLNEQTSITIKSNGPSGTSTMSMRGTNSSQSGVFWNGINIQQPNLAMTDLSRISTCLLYTSRCV